MVKSSGHKYKKHKQMKNEWLWLSVCLSTLLASGCASAMGTRRSCDSPVIPIRPEFEICTSDGSGRAFCFDRRRSPSQYIRQVANDDIITNIADHNTQDEWIRSVLDACKK